MDDVRYAVSGGTPIAYHVSGEGPGLVFLGGFGTHMDAVEVTLDVRLWLERLADTTRFVIYDQRGSGLSDRGTAVYGLDVWVQDLEAVLDAAGLSVATLVAQDMAGPIAIAFAARRPERVSGLVLMGSYARFLNGDDYDAGVDRDYVDLVVPAVVAGWGVAEGDLNRIVAPGREHGAWREQLGRVQRLAMSPHVLQVLLPALLETDVTGELAMVRAPTLVLHSRGDRFVPLRAGQYVADRVVDAHLVEFDSNQHYLFFEHSEAAVDEILAFMGLQGTKPVGSHELAAVWFSDIVGSTEQLRASGDSAWRYRLEQHDRLVDHYLLTYGGELVKRLGDGVLALFSSTQDAVRGAARFSSACARLGLPVRIGIHVGDVERRPDGDVLGLAVHTAQRAEAAATPGQVLLTATASGALAGAGFDVASVGIHDLKGIGSAELYALRNA